jgi:phosphoribosylcarboxyaminoimidazole (NCAIR) mutase
MNTTPLLKSAFAAALAAALSLAPRTGWSQASPFRGLWVGSAALNAVNEVSIPLDAGNVPIAPNPEVPTLTFDRADIRLLIHVNGAGQARLLKDVAILNRVHGQTTDNLSGFAQDRDLALVTDPRRYPDFPPQPAMRYASAVFDFGDAKATEALDALVEAAAQGAAAFTTNSALDVSTQGARVTARNSAIALIEPVLAAMAVKANVAEGFAQFLLQFNTAALGAIVDDTSDPVVATLTAAAEQLRDQSFYGDTRALDMLAAVVSAVDAAHPTNRARAAHQAASGYADVEDLHQRFISGAALGDMLAAAAVQAGTAAKLPGATASSIEAAVRGIPETIAALTNALQAKVQMYNDTRSVEAVDVVLGAIAADAAANTTLTAGEIRLLSEQAGRSALANLVARYPLPAWAPTLDYTAFVTSGAFAGAPAAAAYAAADAAILERAANPLYTPYSLYAAARLAVIRVLQAAYSTAARAMRTELPLAGSFGPGSGDPRRVAELAQPSDLGPPGLEGRLYLPASHPTNPFRHRRHPDHTRGYNIERIIRLDFDGVQGDSLEAAGYGVDRITGTYREEIFGLHKPLGPDPDTNPVGLRTEGRFELNRVSFIDTLNTR